MIIRQISIFLENKPGTLSEALTILKRENINMRALSLADTADFGILRLIVNDPLNVSKILQREGFAVKITEVLVLKVDDHPGSLQEKLQKISEANVNVEYMYAFASGNGGDSDNFARVIIKVDNLKLAADIVGDENEVFDNVDAEMPSFYW